MASNIRSRTQLLTRARQGHPQCQMEYAERLLNENQEECQDSREALLFLGLAVNQNHTPAILKLAECYDRGRGVLMNPQQAFRYYLKSASLGNPEAQYELGKRFMTGYKGLPCDKEISIQWFQLAASQHHAKALYRLAVLHDDDSGKQNHVTSFMYLAADLGHPRAQLKAATRLLKATDEESPSKGVHYLMGASKAGLSEAHLLLGVCLLTGKGTPKNPNKAVRHLQLATDMTQNGVADYILALCYLGGISVGKDMVQAMGHLKKAVIKGENRAYLLLGRFLEGSTDKTTHLHACQCYGKLVKGPMKMKAFYYLSLCYERGSGGLDRDTSLSLDYLRLAAEYGHPRAKAKLGQASLLGELEETEFDTQLNLGYLEEAALQEDPMALACLCIVYSKRDHFQLIEETRQNYEKISTYYDRAVSSSQKHIQQYQKHSTQKSMLNKEGSYYSSNPKLTVK